MAGVQRTLTYTVEIDGKQVQKELNSIEGYEGRIADLKSKIAKTPIGSKEYQKLNKELKKTEGGFDLLQKANQGFLTSLSQAPGVFGLIGQSILGVKDTFKTFQAQFLKLDAGLANLGSKILPNVAKGTKGVSIAMKVLRGAIISTGVGALVVALGSLIAYFTNTEKGSKTLKVAMTALGVVFGRLTDAASKLGEFIVQIFTEPQEAFDTFNENVIQPVREFFSDLGGVLVNRVLNGFNNLKIGINKLRAAFNDLVGDEEEAAELRARNAELQAENAERNRKDLETASEYYNKVKDAVTGLVDEVKDAINVADQLVSATRNIRDLEQAIIVQNAQLKKNLEENKRIVDDTTLSYEERKAALDKVNEANEQIIANELKLAREKENLLRLQIQEEGNYEKREELETELAGAIANRIAKEQEYTNVKVESDRKSREIDQQEIDRQNTISQKITDLNNQRIEGVKQRALLELQAQEEAAIAELEKLKATEEEKQAIRDAYSELRVQAEQTVQDEIQAILDQSVYDAEERAALELQRQRENALEELRLREATEQEVGQVQQYYDQLAYDQARAFSEQRARLIADAIRSIGDSFGQLAEGLDESSAAYKVLIKVQQAAALAATSVALAESFKGLAKDIGKGFPTNLIAVASTLALIATAFSQFKALTGFDAKKQGGGDSGGGDTSVRASGSRGTFRNQGGMIGGQGTNYSDSISARLSKGESVINARSTQMFKPILSAINQAGGGKRFNAGGVIGGSEARMMSLLDRSNVPIKTYVVSSDVTSTQQMDRKIKTGSIL